MNAENKDHQAAFRERQKQLGRRGRLIYLTDEEKQKVDAYLKRLRKKEGMQ